MAIEKVVGTFSRQDNIERILVVERADGLFSYKKQVADRTGAWGTAGPPCGVYDSPDTAIAEAQQRVWWLCAVSTEADEWTALAQKIALIVGERPQEYEPAIRQNLDELLLVIRSTNRPAPAVSSGYWATFCLTWEIEEARNLQIEVFDDRYEIYRFFDGKTDIWSELHVPGEPLSAAFTSELPKPA